MGIHLYVLLCKLCNDTRRHHVCYKTCTPNKVLVGVRVDGGAAQ